MKRIWRMAGVVTVCMALGFATLGADIQTAYAQEEVRGAGAQTADGWSYETKVMEHLPLPATPERKRR